MATKTKIRFSTYFIPLLFTGSIWLAMSYIEFINSSFRSYGVYPRHLSGLKGIFLSPFIHANWQHLINNSIPLLLLSAAIIYFYRKVAFKVFFYSYVVTGLLVWIAGKEANHIGASGVVYAFASFTFFSGIFRKYPPLIALSMLVVFAYGGMVWGTLPLVPNVSWESHLFGAIVGLVLAINYRKTGPQRKKYVWEYEEEEEEEDDEFPENKEETPLESPRVMYYYKPKDTPTKPEE